MIDPLTISEIQFNEKDFKIEWYSGTGAGGQHRNKHQNSCRITHIKTGQIATAQCRSRENSFNEAKHTILKKLNEQHISSHNNEQSILRKNQIGSGMRGDKVRTYRFQDNTAKDHQTGNQVPLDRLLAGNFHLLW